MRNVRFVDSATVKVSDLDALGVELYPNPVQDAVIIQGETPAQLLLLDANNRLVLQKENPTDWIDLKHLPAGVYVAFVIMNDGRKATQIITKQ